MSLIVAKFGGTSLANAAQFRKVHSIIMENPERRYIVPSAPGKRNSDDYKITDLLYLCHAHVNQAISFDEVFNVISNRYLEIISDLGLSLDLKPYLAEIKEKIAEGASADYVASRGEYLNGIILAKLIGYDFVDPGQVVIFNDRGQLDLELAQNNLAKVLTKSPKAVVPGFYGATSTGQVKTFSRGGSDISGSLVARSVEADLYENWTDVSGFLMADPRIVKDSKPMAKITYRELRELAYMGATVLHEESVFPVRQAGIPINIKNTNDPGHPGTIIVNEAESNDSITGIAGKKDFTVIAVEKEMMNSELGFGRKLLSIMEANTVSFEHIPTGIDTMSVVIADSQLNGKLEKILEEIRNQCKPDSLEVYPNMALIATVGRGMVYTPGIAAKLFNALAQSNINVRMIDQGSSELNIIVGVHTTDFEKAVQAIYQAFVH
jgi:aspartate kinase